MARERRVFLVNIDGGEGLTNRLIRARGPATARDHVAGELIAVKEATPQELVELGAAGIKIEDAAQ